MSEEVRNGLMKQRRKAREKNKELQQENQQLKERVAYLERSVNRKEEEIINLRMEQELDLYKSVLNEKELEIKTLVLELLRIAKQNYYRITNDKFEEAKKKIISVEFMGDNDMKYFIEELDEGCDKK